MPFAYGRYYRRVQDQKRLQVAPAEVTWVERHRRPRRAYDVVLYLGCNILRTPRVAADVVAVFAALDVDFVAVAGVQYCCGITWERAGDRDAGDRVSERTIERLASYGAPTVVMWCPSCDVHFSDVVTGREAHDLPFGVTHAARFLADAAQRGDVPWVRPVEASAVLHVHSGRPGHEAGQRRARSDAQATTDLLREVPGLSLLGSVRAPEGMDYDCGPGCSDAVRPVWLDERSRLMAAARATGADTLVTISHACQREWCDAGDDALAVRNYTSLVAEALGVPRSPAEDLLSRFKQGMSVGEIVAASREFWSSHGLTEAGATRMVSRYTWHTDSPRSTAP